MTFRPFQLLACLVLIVVSFFETEVASAGTLFTGPINSPAGAFPWGLAAGDFDGSTGVDVAVTNMNSGTRRSQVKVLLGVGDGRFHKPVGYQVGTRPSSVATGDFNGDGKLDLVVASNREPHHTGRISVLLGNGDGSFQPQVTYKAGESPVRVAVGDLNGDGKLDVVVAGRNKGVSVLLGNGDGTLQPQIKVPAGRNPVIVAVGDLNGDGKLDLVVVAQQPKTTTALLGNGDGTFLITWTADSGSPTDAIALGDFNGDGRLDLVEVYSQISKLKIFLGNGNGTFQQTGHYSIEGAPVAVVVVDLDGDGKLDTATANRNTSSVSVLRGRGDGTFEQQVSSPLAPLAMPIDMTAADVNGDGWPDLVITDFENQIVSVLLNTGNK